jgi:hypothetical protein
MQFVWTKILGRFARDERGSMVVNIGKASIAIAFLSVIAANWLAVGVNETDRNNLSQLASNAGKSIKNGVASFDPLTTGSLQKRAADTKLDPCVLPARR